jgi:hypothetical protein
MSDQLQDARELTVNVARSLAEQAKQIGLHSLHATALIKIEEELSRVLDANRLLINACRAVDADVELAGKASEVSIEMVRAAIAQVGAA